MSIRTAKMRARQKWTPPHSCRSIDQKYRICTGPRPPRKPWPCPAEPGGRTYFIRKPVKANASRSKKAIKSTIKFTVARFNMRAPEQYTKRLRS